MGVSSGGKVWQEGRGGPQKRGLFSGQCYYMGKGASDGVAS